MAKYGDKIYFGKLTNGEIDEKWIAGVVAEDKSDAIEKIKSNIDDEEMELVTLSISDDNDFTLFQDLDEEEQECFEDCDFYLFDSESLS